MFLKSTILLALVYLGEAVVDVTPEVEEMIKAKYVNAVTTGHVREILELEEIVMEHLRTHPPVKYVKRMSGEEPEDNSKFLRAHERLARFRGAFFPQPNN